MSWSTCKYCFEKIVWAQMPAGNWLPMDPEGGGLHECVPLERHDEGSSQIPTTVPHDSTWTVGFHPAGVLVGQVLEPSPAAKAGLQSGDILVKANDQETRDIQAFYTVRDSVAPGGELKLTVQRGNGLLVVSVRRPEE